MWYEVEIAQVRAGVLFSIVVDVHNIYIESTQLSKYGRKMIG